MAGRQRRGEGAWLVGQGDKEWRLLLKKHLDHLKPHLGSRIQNSQSVAEDGSALHSQSPTAHLFSTPLPIKAYDSISLAELYMELNLDKLKCASLEDLISLSCGPRRVFGYACRLS